MSKFQHIKYVITDFVFHTKYIGKFIHHLHTNFYIPIHKQLNVMTLYVFLFFFFFVAVALRPNTGYGLLILEVSRSHTMTHHSR